MIDLARTCKYGLAIVAAFSTLLTAAPSSAETGTIRARIVKAGFIVGVGGGSGVLRFRGKTYRLRISGISAGTIGVAGVDLVGTARNLRTASDITGSYTSVGAGFAVAGGVRGARLQNANGVILDVQGVQAGLELSLNMSGVTIALQ